MWYVYEDKGDHGVIVCRCADKISAELTAQMLTMSHHGKRFMIVETSKANVVS